MNEAESAWRLFARRHWKAVVAFVAGIVVVAAAAAAVFLWFAGRAQDSGLVPQALGDWSVGYVVTFFLNLLFWELVVVGIPVVVAAVAAYRFWWKGLPAEERAEYRMRRKNRPRSTGAKFGDAICLLTNIFFLLIVYLDGNWNLAFSSWTFDYLVGSYLWALLGVLAAISVPMAIGGLWWLAKNAERSA